MNDEAQKMRSAPDEISSKSAVNDQWLGDVVDFLHLLAGDLSQDNRLVAVAARQLILNAPRLSAEQSDGVWHDWHGGECPVDPDDKVEVKFRYFTGSSVVYACELDWSHSDSGANVVAYRLVN